MIIVVGAVFKTFCTDKKTEMYGNARFGKVRPKFAVLRMYVNGGYVEP